MTAFLSAMVFWHWLILGVALMAVEAFAPGAFFLWPGVSAIIIGIVAYLIPGLSWQLAVTIWGLLSVVTVTGWIAYRKNNPAKPTENPTLNRRAEQYIGRPFTLTSPIVNGKGDMRVDDSMWRVVSDEDLPAGAQVKVVAVEGTSLRIEAD